MEHSRGSLSPSFAMNFNPVASPSGWLLLASVALSPLDMFVFETIFMKMFIKSGSEEVLVVFLHFYRVEKGKEPPLSV